MHIAPNMQVKPFTHPKALLKICDGKVAGKPHPFHETKMSKMRIETYRSSLLITQIIPICMGKHMHLLTTVS